MKRLSWIVLVAVVSALAVAAGPLVNAQSQQVQTQKPATPQKPAEAAQKPATPQKPAEPAQPRPGAAAAPTAEAKSETPALEQPADFKAFNEAAKADGAAKRVAAYEKFLTDFPDSTLKNSAESQIRSQSLSQVAEFTKKYLAGIEKNTKSATPSEASSIYSSAANELNRQGVLLEQAEEFAQKALKYDDVEKYLADIRAALAKPRPASKLPPNTTTRMSMSGGAMTVTLVPSPQSASSAAPARQISDDERRTMFRSQRAQLQTTLGQIYFKRGKNAEAEKTLKAVYNDASVPSSSKVAAARVLADMARKDGNNAALQEYLTVMVVAGSSPEVHKELNDLYKKAHNGSLDGFDKLLDDKFHASVKPLEVKPYERPKAKGGDRRLVLAELLTGAACPPCVAADMAFDAVLERYSRQDVALVVYHQHIPGPDPMTNPATQARGAKDGIYKLQGVPTFAIDGVTTIGGGGAEQAEGVFKSVSATIEKNLGVAPAARLALKAKVVGNTIEVTADVSKIASTSKNLKLQIALVEEQQRYSGTNGVRFHPMVVRSLGGPEYKGFAVPVKGLHATHTFDLTKILADNKKAIDEFLDKPFRGGEKPLFTEGRRDAIDANRLMVVAFVQDEDPAQSKPAAGAASSGMESITRKVLQAAFVKVPPAVKKTTN